MTDRDKVIAYLKNENTKPLKFYVKPGGGFFDPYHTITLEQQQEIVKKLKSLQNKRLLLRTMVVRVIELCAFLPTLEEKTPIRKSLIASNIQCYQGARRTAVDIWRIILKYRPETEIFDVMRILHALVTSGTKAMTTSFCSMIHRRTFRYEGSISHIYNPDRDEFGISDFARWKSI